MSFKKAERKQAKLKIGLQGPSGSGKTFSALTIAQGMGGKIAVIDTENKSASLYADRFEFDICELEAPFTTEKYIQAMQDAAKGDYDIVIIDSATHQWMGEGGLYERKTQVDARGGNSFVNWAKFTPEHTKFLNAIVQYPKHLIVTVRSKQDYAVTENDKGKATPKKIGLAPVQREGFEYELTLMLELAMDHSAQASKDRTGLFDQMTFKPTVETGRQLIEWLNSGKAPGPWAPGIYEEAHVKSLLRKAGWNGQNVKDTIAKNFAPKTLFSELNEDEYSKLLHVIETAIIAVQTVK